MSNLTVKEYLSENFTAPFYLKTDKYEVGTVLYTANPYQFTNATIIAKLDTEHPMFTVLTDIGNFVTFTQESLAEHYLPPVNKRTSTVPENDEDYFDLSLYKDFKYVNNI